MSSETLEEIEIEIEKQYNMRTKLQFFLLILASLQQPPIWTIHYIERLKILRRWNVMCLYEAVELVTPLY